MAERPAEPSKAWYQERVKELDLEDLACMQELAVLGFKNVSHEDLSRHHCVDWLKAHEAQFSRTKTLETADLTGIPQKSITGPVNSRAHSGSSQASNEYSQNQDSDSRTAESGGEAA